VGATVVGVPPVVVVVSASSLLSQAANARKRANKRTSGKYLRYWGLLRSLGMGASADDRNQYTME
jgi:hypothetical protein